MTATNLDKLKRLVEGCDLLIYAPPAYGKTTYVRQTRYDISPIDTDDLLIDPCPPNSYFEVLVTNVPDLIDHIEVGVSIAFLPPKEQFKDGCIHRNLPYEEVWYEDACNSVSKYDVVITTGLPILNYERFLYNCFNAYCDGSPMPKVPSSPSAPKKVFKPKVSYDEQLMFELGSHIHHAEQQANDECDTVDNRYTNYLARADSLPDCSTVFETVIPQVSHPVDDCNSTVTSSNGETNINPITSVAASLDCAPVLTPKKKRFFVSVLKSGLQMKRCYDLENFFSKSHTFMWLRLGAYKYFHLNTGFIRLESVNFSMYCSSAILSMLDPGYAEGRFRNKLGAE